MIRKTSFILLVFYLMLIFMTAGCDGTSESTNIIDREPLIEPDYSGVTIPQNIAPLNFKINEDGKKYRLVVLSENGHSLSVNSGNGIISFPQKGWKKLLKDSRGGKIRIEVTEVDKEGSHNKFKPIEIYIVEDSIDPYICYRFMYPGYEAYLQLKIIQRSTESFYEKSLVENQLLKTNCINCHSFCGNDPDKFIVHVRGSVGGTYFSEGDRIVRRNLKTPEMKFGAVYPAWHPGGKLITFSSNSIVQSFHASQQYNIEVTDLASSLVIYNVEKNEMSAVQYDDSVKYMETFPEWSQDGRYLYYCRAIQTTDSSDITKIKYDLVRRSFDENDFSFGKAEMVYDARSIDKSVSFPRISPDGKYLVFTLHNYGNFSVWHKEADLYIIDIETGKTERMSLNSNETESYHSWSTNGKWLVFSSKRDDGLTSRPYFAYIGQGQIGKPFILPQKDPTLYRNLLKTFNRPEFVNRRIEFGPRDFESAAGEEPLKTGWAENNK